MIDWRDMSASRTMDQRRVLHAVWDRPVRKASVRVIRWDRRWGMAFVIGINAALWLAIWAVGL